MKNEIQSQCKLAALVAVLLTVLLSSSDGQQSSAQQPAPKFTSRTELVLVPAVVTDRAGEHVAGLSQDDFVVLENGKPKQISVFDEVRGSTHPLPAQPAATPNEFSNYGSVDGSKSGRLTIIAFDAIHTPVIRQAVLRRQLLARLREVAAASEPTALYSLGLNGAQTVVDFTTSPQVLAEALSELKYSVPLAEVRSLEGLSHETGAVDMQAQEDAMAQQGAAPAPDAGGGTSALQLQLEVFQRQLAESMTSQERYLGAVSVLNDLQQIARACAAIPGRKSLIWVTGGFPLEISMQSKGIPTANLKNLGDVFPVYERTMEALNDAQVAVYPLDVRGMINDAVVPPSYETPTGTYQQQASWTESETMSTMDTIAGATGGKVYRNSNDLGAGVEEAIKDSSSYYLLGYYVHPGAQTKVSWQTIAVKVRRKGTQVRARSGYFLEPPASADSRQRDLMSALTSPLDFTALGVTVQWTGTTAGEGARKRIAYDVLARPGITVDEADSNHMLLEIVSAVTSGNGKLVAEPVLHTLEGHLDSGKLARLEAEGWTYHGVLELPPGEYKVRFAVRDDLSGRLGSVAAPLKVEP